MTAENAGIEQAPRRNARGEARKAHIIDAALRVVGTRGISGVTHRAVASEATITPGLVTYYFPTLDPLLEATLRSYVDADMERVAAAIEALEHSGPRADRGAVLGAVFQAVAVEPAQQVAQFELYLESVRRPGLRAVARDCLNGYANLARIALERLGSTRAEEGSRALLALFDGIALQRIVDDTEGYLEQVAIPAVLTLVEAYAPEGD